MAGGWQGGGKGRRRLNPLRLHTVEVVVGSALSGLAALDVSQVVWCGVPRGRSRPAQTQWGRLLHGCGVAAAQDGGWRMEDEGWRTEDASCSSCNIGCS